MLLKPSRVATYKDILWLVIKYGNADIVDQTGIRSQLDDANDMDCEPGQPEELTEDLERLGPTFVKLGQMLSTRGDLLPPDYLKALSRLQDNVEQVPFDEIECVIVEELGAEIGDVFASFEREPLASASLGQVHRARLRNGREVAVKVQRPDIIDDIDRDITAMRDIALTFENTTDVGTRYRFSRIIDTLEANIVRELDYQYEARHSASFTENLSDFDQIVVPQVIEEISTQRMLVMDYIEGRKITELGRLELLELDREGLVHEIFRAYLNQVLVDGFFHADPHPGNLVLTTDGKVALLDFGMVARVSPQACDNLMKLLLTICEGRGEDAAKAAMELGVADDRFDAEAFTEQISRLVTLNQDVPVKQLKAGMIVMEIQRIAAEVGMLPTDELTMLGKTLLNLDRVVETLHPEFDPNAAMRQACSELVHKRSGNNISLGRLYHTFLETTDLMQSLPERLNKITDLAAENKLRVHVDAIDEKYLMKGMQKIANRITMGVILGALIVGASLMMRLETSLTVFGYPAIAMTFFLTAGISGLVLVFRMMWSDES